MFYNNTSQMHSVTSSYVPVKVLEVGILTVQYEHNDTCILYIVISRM